MARLEDDVHRPRLQRLHQGDPPVTVVVTRYVKRGCGVRFEKLWRDMVPVRNAGVLLTLRSQAWSARMLPLMYYTNGPGS